MRQFENLFANNYKILRHVVCLRRRLIGPSVEGITRKCGLITPETRQKKTTPSK